MAGKEVLKLQFDEHNANQGTERGRELLKKSLEKLGAGRSIVCDRNGTILAGNKTYEQATALGIPIELIHTQGDRLVAVVREDLDLDEDDRARLLAYSDNRISELDLSWSVDQLLSDVDILGATNLWNESELALLQDDFDLAAFEGMGADKPEPEDKPVKDSKNKEESDLLPFHVLLSVQQRERLFQAINEAKSKHGLETTAEALDTIVQEFLNVS